MQVLYQRINRISEFPGGGIQERRGRWEVTEDDCEISGLGIYWIGSEHQEESGYMPPTAHPHHTHMHVQMQMQRQALLLPCSLLMTAGPSHRLDGFLGAKSRFSQVTEYQADGTHQNG